MKPLPVHYIGALADSSGYSQAARNYVIALGQRPDISLTASAVTFEQQYTKHKLNNMIKPFLQPDPNSPVRIVHLTPENYPKVMRHGAYNIGYVAWETTKIPHYWVALCNLMDEIWVPSEWNVKAFKDSGVVKPVFCVPHGLEIPELDKATDLKMIPAKFDDSYKFYSVFQWIRRKNPIGLLHAYLTEFLPNERVVLCLKTYRANTTEPEKQVIKNDIAAVKASLNLKEYPPILFFSDLFTSEEMSAYHQEGDCFVLPACAEGFGLGPAEAMTYGKPTIIPSLYHGDFISPATNYVINSTDYPVHDMQGMVKYHGHMLWGNPDIMHLRKLMRYCFNNPEEAVKIGAAGRELMKENYNWKKIGKLMSDRLMVVRTERGF